jgi:hypothetical protein
MNTSNINALKLLMHAVESAGNSNLHTEVTIGTLTFKVSVYTTGKHHTGIYVYDALDGKGFCIRLAVAILSKRAVFSLYDHKHQFSNLPICKTFDALNLEHKHYQIYTHLASTDFSKIGEAVVVGEGELDEFDRFFYSAAFMKYCKVPKQLTDYQAFKVADMSSLFYQETVNGTEVTLTELGDLINRPLQEYINNVELSTNTEIEDSQGKTETELFAEFDQVILELKHCEEKKQKLWSNLGDLGLTDKYIDYSRLIHSKSHK